MSYNSNVIRFNSSNRKPNIGYAAIISAMFFIGLTILVLNRLINPFYFSLLFCLYLFVMVVIFVEAFIRQLKYNPYSYNSIYYIGFSLFIFSTLIIEIFVYNYIKNLQLGYYTAISNLLLPLISSAMNFMLISFPFVLVFSLSFIVSNIVLLKKEGRSFQNILAIILSVLLLGGVLFLYRFDYYFSGSELQAMIHDVISNIFACIYIYFECMLIGTIITNLIVINYKAEYDKDYAIILGCGLMKDGNPTPLLKGRIDRALSFYHEQLKATGKKLTFICSGGQGSNEVISESQSMKNYLMGNGISEEDIIMEDKSTSTYENMLYSKTIIDNISSDSKIIFSTNNFHVFRSGLMSRRVGMASIGIGSKTKWYFWPNAWVREFVGLISQHKVKQMLILGTMIILYIITTILNYRVRLI